MEAQLHGQFQALADARLLPLMPEIVVLPRSHSQLQQHLMLAAEDMVPVVFLHGEGDAGSNPGMQSLCKSAADAYPGLYVACADVAKGLTSITTPLAEQVDEFATFVRNDPKLANGFHAVGLSQGGLVLRGYVETRNTPRVRRLISLCAPHGGVSACPSSAMYKMVCPLWRLAPYTARLAFTDYWKDADDKSTYLDRSRWLADVNNERDTKRESRRPHSAEARGRARPGHAW